MNLEEAKEIVKGHQWDFNERTPGECSRISYYESKGFIEGHEAGKKELKAIEEKIHHCVRHNCSEHETYVECIDFIKKQFDAEMGK